LSAIITKKFSVGYFITELSLAAVAVCVLAMSISALVAYGSWLVAVHQKTVNPFGKCHQCEKFHVLSGQVEL
jgi:hypothetical protein